MYGIFSKTRLDPVARSSTCTQFKGGVLIIRRLLITGETQPSFVVDQRGGRCPGFVSLCRQSRSAAAEAAKLSHKHNNYRTCFAAEAFLVLCM